MPKVSIIIPCFNLGKYLNEAVESVLAQTFQDFELIVVNDGSTDKKTNQIINEFNNSRVKVIHTTNQGLSGARNTGISQSEGEYILPLDADDKIAPTYLEKAVKVLDRNNNIGIVYCEAVFFGENQGKWVLPEYSFPEILKHNVIFSSSLFRKSDWQKENGYNLNMIYGWEDYDFWLSIIELKREVFKIPEILFFYRSRLDSMNNRMKNEHRLYSYKQIFKNHREMYADNIEYVFEHMCLLAEDRKSLTERILELRPRQLILLIKGFKWRVLVNYVGNFTEKKPEPKEIS